MTENSKQLVRAGYDQISEKYHELFGVSSVRQEWAGRLMSGLPEAGGRVLDLGCVAGLPVAKDLCAGGHRVVGIDGSAEQIARAKANVPQAEFILADMASVAFENGSFDGVGAFYSMTHLPADEQCRLIRKVSAWLRPGGVFVASFGAGGAGAWSGEWLGVPMFFDHNDEATTLKTLEANRFFIERAEVQKQDNEETSFFWVKAIRK
jgi:SAM-dependent methyltransferase